MDEGSIGAGTSQLNSEGVWDPWVGSGGGGGYTHLDTTISCFVISSHRIWVWCVCVCV
jgi:hypothetical protein